MNDEFEETLTAISMSPVTVNVDFNDLLQDHGETETFRLLGLLKDLMR